MKTLATALLLALTVNAYAGMPRPSLPTCCRLYDNILFAEKTNSGVVIAYMKGPRSDDDAGRIQELMTDELATSKQPSCYAFVNFRTITDGGSERAITDKKIVPVVNGTVSFYGAPEDWGDRPITGHDSKHTEYTAEEFHEKLKQYITEFANKGLLRTGDPRPARQSAEP